MTNHRPNLVDTRGLVRSIDVVNLRRQYRQGRPFPFFVIDNFLDQDFATQVFRSYPDYETAKRMGWEFDALNERLKVQVTDRSQFPEHVGRLSDALASPAFLNLLEEVTGIRNLQADPALNGGGMHLTGASGRLDVHVDFNYLEEQKLHRRLNILVYLNEQWDENWGGNIEFWDKDVKTCVQSFVPIFNRCVVFETSEISYHGVTPIKCPADQVRKSFAGYYYTADAPPNWDGKSHSTVFKARPSEVLRKMVLMPWRGLSEKFIRSARSIKNRLLS